MWSQDFDETTVYQSQLQEWFDEPFESMSEFPQMMKWQALVAKGDRKKLSDKWAKPHANMFKKQYVAMCLDFCRTQWRKLYALDNFATALTSATSVNTPTLASTQTSESGGSDVEPTHEKSEVHEKTSAQSLRLLRGSNFVFDASTWSDSATTMNEIQNNQVTSTLLYYMTEIVDETILGRLRHLRSVTVSSGIAWNDVWAVVSSEMKDSLAISSFREVACYERVSRSALTDWAQKLHSASLHLEKQGDRISDATYVELFTEQISKEEKAKLLPIPSNLADIVTKLKTFKVSDLPIYLSSAAVVSRIPVFRANKGPIPVSSGHKSKSSNKI